MFRADLCTDIEFLLRQMKNPLSAVEADVALDIASSSRCGFCRNKLQQRASIGPILG